MPYVFSETQAGEKRSATAFPSLTSEVLEETFAQTFEENPIASISRANELRQDYQTGPKLNAESARAKLKERGMDADLKVSDAGITQAALDTLMFRKMIEKRRQEVFQQAQGGAGQMAARIGVALGTSLVDPANVLTGFVPVIGQARYAKMLGQAGGIAGRTAIRVGVGAAEGLAGAALVEPIIAGSRRYEQADYDMSDSLLNVAFGGLFGAGLHSTFGAVSDGLRMHFGEATPIAARDKVDALTQEARTQRVEPTVDGIRAPESIRDPIPEPNSAAARVAEQSPIVREQAMKQAVAQAVSGELISVDRMIAPQTETPAFKQWFGESKVVDEAGQPMRVYHGTATDFAEFDAVKAQTDGFHFTTNPAMADRYAVSRAMDGGRGANVVPAYVRMENPKQVDLISPETIRQAKEEGHDGAYKDDHFVAFEPTQIKSAVGNSGRFDSNSNSLTDAIDPEDTAELPGLIEHADEVIARETDTGTPTADNLKMATEEFSLAQSDLQSFADRMGMEAEDAELTAVYDAAKMSERWAKASELATVCLMRGG